MITYSLTTYATSMTKTWGKHKYIYLHLKTKKLKLNMISTSLVETKVIREKIDHGTSSPINFC